VNLRVRLSVLAAVAALAAGLVGCSSSSDSSKVTAQSLGRSMQASLKQVSSAHLEVDAGGLGSYVVDATFDGGQATASEVTATQGGQTTLIRTVQDKSWAKLPTAAGSKPWTPVTEGSSRPEIAALSQTLTLTRAASSLDSLSQLVTTAGDFQKKGEEKVGGVDATHYSLKLDPAKGPAGSELTTLLKQVGQKAVPVQLWVDGKDRPVRFTITSLVSVTATISNYDAPLTISPPPADQISTP
jgi:hypothetical protein